MTHSNPFPPNDTPDPAYGREAYSQAPDPLYTQEPVYSEQPVYGNPPPVGGSQFGGGEQSTSDAAREQAGQVAGTAADAGKHVAGVAQEQAQQVTAEAKNQAKDLLHQTKGELTDQAATQQQRLASGLRSLGDELGSMAQSSENPGLASDLARQAADHSGTIASWLDEREPGHVLDEVKSFARRRPGTFLALAAGAGLLAGRLGRGLTADAPETSSPNAGKNGSTTPPQTPSAARRVVPASQQYTEPAYGDATYGDAAYGDAGQGFPPSMPPAERPQGTGYSTQPGFGAPGTEFRP